ncbi:hypothetical protein MMC07_007927 [Pseudocyphellaria aurata]|nr:hypothetical protein [Pseudocyphellaria aurata]
MSEFSVDKRNFSRQSSYHKRSDDVAYDSNPPVWPEATKSPTPTSSLLQDRLREKKAETQRVSRISDLNGQRPDGQGSDLDNRAVQSSPLVPTATGERSNTRGRRSSAVGGKDASAPKEMGVREMEQYTSKIEKQNFDLKLELFHRRQKTKALEAKLEAKLERLDKLESDNRECHAINEELLLQLEQRDAAVTEAVGMICVLEAKVEELEAEKCLRATTPELEFQADDESGEPSGQPLSQVDKSLPITPPTPGTLASQKDSHAAKSPIKKSESGVENAPLRMPSFLKENKRSTQALRSLYLSDGTSTPGNPSVFSLPRPGSLYLGDEQRPEADPDGFTLNSPRLSMLSESSFLSVYGKAKGSDLISPKKKDSRSHDESSSEEERPPLDSKQHNPNIHKWINESKRTSPKRRLAHDSRGDRFSSIDEVVDDGPNDRKPGQKARQMSPRSPSRQKREESVNFQPLPPLGGTMFGHDVLPPTPDTMSTANIDAHSTAPSIITERSLMDGMPFEFNSHREFASALRPRTAETSGDPSKLDPSPVFDEGDAWIKSDGEHESTQVAQSDAGTIVNPLLSHSASTVPKGSLNNRRQASALPVRPLLGAYATDMMFNGEGYASVQPARTMSYPSPAEGKRRRSVQFPPAGHEASDMPKTVNGSHSTKSRAGGKNMLVTPTKERIGAPASESPSDGRGGESWSPSDTDNSDRRQSSSARLKNLFGKLTSPGTKSGAALSDPPVSELQSNTLPSTSRHSRPSSVHLQNGSKPLPDPPTSRIARPSSARDPNYSQFGTARRYSLVPDASTLGAQDVHSAKPEPGKESVDLARGADDLPYGKASGGGLVHRRTDSESRQSNRLGGEETVSVAGRKWGVGIGRSASAKMKEGLSGLRNKPKPANGERWEG